MTLLVSVPQPFSLAAVLRSHGWVQLAPFQLLGEGDGFLYVTRLGAGRVVPLEVSSIPEGLGVRSDSDLVSSEWDDVRRQLTWMLQLESDLSPFHDAVADEPKLARVAEQGIGRILRCPTLFEDIIKTILTTNTAWGGTRRMVKGLVDLYGDAFIGDSSLRAFPTAGRLAELDEETLRAQARLGYRAPSVLSLARSVVRAEIDLEGLKGSVLPTGELRKGLLSIRGVGPYAAANLLMLLGRSDFLPIDSWALKMVSQEWHGGAPVTPSDVEAAFARWGQWQGLAYWFWDWDQSD